jgi:hypothetical protein
LTTESVVGKPPHTQIAHLTRTIETDEQPLTCTSNLVPLNCALAACAAGGSLQAGVPSRARVKQLRAYTVEKTDADQGADCHCHDVEDEHWIK